MGRATFIPFTEWVTGLAIPDWFTGLQFRLIVAFTVTLGVALAAVGFFVSETAESETDRFRARNQEFRVGRVHRMISRHFSEYRHWEGVQPSLEQAGSFYDRRFVVVDANGQVVGDSHHRFGQGRKEKPKRGRSIPIVVDGNDEGDLVVAPVVASAGDGDAAGANASAADPPTLPPPLPDADDNAGSAALPLPTDSGQAREPLVSRVTAEVNKSLLLAGIFAGAVGIILIFLVSRRILAPVQTLGAAARRLGQGDLTQRVPARGPAEIRQLGNTFNAMAENLQAAERQRRNLTADVAHELRTPLSNIQGYLDAVHDGLLEPDQATIGTLRQQTSHLVALVEDLRLLAMAEAGSLALNVQPNSIGDLLAESLEAFRPRAEAKDIQLSLALQDGLPSVSMDRTRISQVAGNLLENAIINTPEGGSITLSAGLAGTGLAGNEVQVTVADTGPGIASEELPRIFDRFYRVDPSRARATGGAGLGLTIARHLVESHGGVIWVESNVADREDEGARFSFTLPVAAGPEAP